MPPGSVIEVNTGRGEKFDAAELSLREFLKLVRSVRNLVTQARAIAPADVSLPTDNTPPAADIAELSNRAQVLRDAFAAAVATLNSALAAQPLNADLIADAMLALHYFGIPGAIPGESLSNIKERADGVLADAKDRLARLQSLEASFQPGPNIAANRDHHVARIHGVLGEQFRVLPVFKLPNSAEWTNAFSDQAALLDGNATAALTWFSQAAKVRAGMGRFDEALRFSELLSGADPLAVTVGQMPAGLGERWVGMDIKSKRPLGGRLSLVVHGLASVDASAPVCGLFIDEWTEVIPNTSELTGIVFPHDAPGARAPQSILLAVSPGNSMTWSLGTLESTVLETIELAKLRAVDSIALGEVGHYLPGLYFAFNVANDTVSTRFIEMTAAEAKV